MSMIKIIPTALLGVTLAYMVHKSGSILTSSLVHFVNNAFAVVMLFYGSEIPFFNEESMTIPMLIGMTVIAMIGIPFGVLLLNNPKKK